LREHGPDQSGDHLAVLVVGGGQQVAHRVDTASLPRGALEATADRLDQTGVRVRDDEAHTG